MQITWVGCHPNNFMRGRSGNTISYVVIHSIVGTVKSATATFARPDRIASATYGIEWDGAIVQWVSEADTSYANGNWDSNQKSITIEHSDQGKPYEPRPDLLYETSANLVADICNRYGIPVDRNHIKKHSEVSLKPTACPAALDIDRIVRRAYEILHPAPPPTPPPVPPPPTPEWKINLAEIGPHVRKVEQDVTLRNFDTGAPVKTYPEGTEITVEFKTKSHLVDWYMTRYSVSKGIPNGFMVSEFDWEDPIIEPPPPSEPPESESPKPPEQLWSWEIIWLAIKEFFKWLGSKFSRK